MSLPKVLLASTDDHTLGIQVAGSILLKEMGINPTLAYLPSHLSRYPELIEHQIVEAIFNEVGHHSKPAIIGFSIKELSVGRSIQLARCIKEKFCDRVSTVAGGAYASLAPEALIDVFDHVVVGSGTGFVPIVDALANNVRAESIIAGPPQDFHYPLFKEALVLGDNGRVGRGLARPLAHAQYKRTPALEIVAGSGCSYACSFCEVSALKQRFGKQYKISISSPRAIIDLIVEATSRDSTKYVYFFDEDFLLKPQSWIDEFAALYSTLVGLPFFIFATPASVIKSPRKLLALVAAGLDTVNMGVQSGSTPISADLFGRHKDVGIVREAVHFLVELHRSGKLASPPMLDVIALNPFEGKQDVIMTIDLLLALPTPFETVIHCMSLFEGTPLKSRALSEGIIPERYRFRYDLHDFNSRVRRNEFGLDYSSAKTLEWMHLNALLYGMNGIHHVSEGQRQAGYFSEEELRHELVRNRHVSIRDVFELINRIPNPMNSSWYAWEQISIQACPVNEVWERHVATAAA